MDDKSALTCLASFPNLRSMRVWGIDGMDLSTFVRRLGMAIAFLAFAAQAIDAQDSPEALLAEAERLYEGGDGSPTALAGVRALLDRIVDEHPSSDLAVSVLLAEKVGEIDVTALNARLDGPNQPDGAAAGASDATEPAEEASAAAPERDPGSFLPLPPGSQTAEAALDLDKQGIRDLQARLLVSGYDPNGIDGIIGRGTRAALRAWQVSEGTEPTGYLNLEQYDRLRVISEAALAAWRANPENERQYLPPPPIALGPGNMSGVWRFTSRCSQSSRIGQITITGVLNVGHAGGNRYSGRVQQSQGFRGQFSGRLEGRRMTAEINWGLLLGRVQVVGTVEDQRLAMNGRDSNRCSFFAVKS